MHLTDKVGIEGNTFLVTGGLGFVGSALCEELIRRGARKVRTLDTRTSSPWSENLKNIGVTLFQGKEMLQVGRINEVNINGTCHVIDACLEYGVNRLVYVSTYNVVYGGKEIVNGNEDLPCFPMDDHGIIDPYGRSKSIAEQLVLKSNASLSKKTDTLLYTCVIRPATIYGPGEERYLPWIVSLAKLGLFRFKIGDKRVKTDWVYLDNLVLALILASMGLLDNIQRKEGSPVAAGQPYFISDGLPVNTFEFIRPLLKSLEYDLPKATLTVSSALILGHILRNAYSFLFLWLNPSWLPRPLILPTEVYKVGVTHYFSILKAKEELGYVPLVSPEEGMSSTITYWQERKRREVEGPTIYIWLLVVFDMWVMFCSTCLPNIGPLKSIRSLSLFVFGSMKAVQIAYAISATAHVVEAIYAWYLAKRVDPENAKEWFWQTLHLGIFSLRFLLKRAWNGSISSLSI
ncbi:hypothetical protein GIB67_033680 [Kingdonia uniflora]|uniref:3-beta hydroxysteroid dehydrogenase/isomerase domain-containing protein n=1 Tax=Kingdonia uniflora TaxID=39325 RepID=A0A7J7P4P8_9MAGN|nr:hypothetical protein GIB67_033680 [Kingdonia uniflora]